MAESSTLDIVLQLSDQMRLNPDQLDEGLLRQGKKLLIIYEEPRPAHLEPDFISAKYESLIMAIEDVAQGAPTLQKNKIGVACPLSELSTHRLQTFIWPIKMKFVTPVYYSLYLNTRVDLTLDGERRQDLTQADLNSLLYFLAYKISQEF